MSKICHISIFDLFDDVALCIRVGLSFTKFEFGQNFIAAATMLPDCSAVVFEMDFLFRPL